MRNEPGWAAGYDLLVRALLKAKKLPEASVVVDEARNRAPGTSEMSTALGRVLFRRGEIDKARQAFDTALKLTPEYVGAIEGLARVETVGSRFESAARLYARAHSLDPDDPELNIAWADYQDDPAGHLHAIEKALSLYAPETEEALSLRAHVAADKALGDRRLNVLKSPYTSYRIKLEPAMNGPQSRYGFLVRVQFNGGPAFSLLLDTGAGGIVLNQKAASRAGLEMLESTGWELKGIGDAPGRQAFHALAREVRIGSLELANVHTIVSGSKRVAAEDGLIGTDLFEQFLVVLDFPSSILELNPYPGRSAPPRVRRSEAPRAPPSGFTRFYRVGHLLLVPTSVNGDPPRLFAIDSGASSNLIDVEAARSSTSLQSDPGLRIRGVKGDAAKAFLAARVDLVFLTIRQRNMEIPSTDLSRHGDGASIAVSGLLGMPVLRQLRLTLDYLNGAVEATYKQR